MNKVSSHDWPESLWLMSLQTAFIILSRSLQLKTKKLFRDVNGSIFCDPTRPEQTNFWPDPTRPAYQKQNSWPDPTWPITGWAVALTCCINHSAKYRKNRFWPPREPKPFNQFWRNLAWLTTFGTPPARQLWWASATWVVGANVWLVTSPSFFFSFFFCFLQRAPKSHFLTGRDDLYAKTRFPAKDVPFGGRDNIRLHL